jgi:hypothetical protein
VMSAGTTAVDVTEPGVVRGWRRRHCARWGVCPPDDHGG